MLAAGMIACIQVAYTCAATENADRQTGAREFKVKDSVIYADGKPFPFIADFTFSADTNDEFYRYWARMGGTAHFIPMTVIHPFEKPDFTLLDREIANAAKFGLYSVVMPKIAEFGGNWGYAKSHPDAEMKGPDGRNVRRAFYPSFTHEGFRSALVEKLKELASHLKDNPYFLGYYWQDEFSYPDWGGYETNSVNLFRIKMMAQYGTLDKLNSAWGTNYVKNDDIVPPAPEEQTGRRWADWQLFRRWAYTDLLRVCYQAVKEVAPNHLVINSMDGWPSQVAASAWWVMPPYADILMRHGIGYNMGYNLMLIREIAEWSGKAGNALCMPPGSDVSYKHFMHLLDSARNGLSYVCVAGASVAGVYRGPADYQDGFRRREPQYTPAKAIIQLEHYLGDTYLTSKRNPPQVGFLVGDRTVSIAGVNGDSVAGILEILTDLNLDFEMVSEHNYAPLKRFKAIIVGAAIGLVSDEMVIAVNEYVRQGGALIMLPGAFERNEWNEPAATNRFVPSLCFGQPVPCEGIVAGKAEISLLDAKKKGAPVCPVEVKPGDNVLARIKGKTNEAAAVISGDGRTLYIGWDIGVPYAKSWSSDFSGKKESVADKQARLEQALGGDAGDRLAVDPALVFQPQRQVTEWIKKFLADNQATPRVVVEGHETPGMVHAKSFSAGSDIWVGIANRVEKPGADDIKPQYDWDIEKGLGGVWPSDFHVPISNANVSVRIPADFPGKIRCFRMPNMTVAGERIVAVPDEIPVEVAKTGSDKYVRFTLPRIDDWAALVLSSGYKPLVGMEIERREIVKGAPIQARINLVNAVDKPIKGELILKDEDGLCKEQPAAIPYDLQPGQVKIADLTFYTGPDIKSGYYSLKAVVRGAGDGNAGESMGLEVRVLDPAIITMTPASGYIYVKPGAPSCVEVKTTLRDDKSRGKISVKIAGFERFIIDKNEEEWNLEGDREHVFAFYVKKPDIPNLSETGTVTVVENYAGGLRNERAFPVRITAGVVAYRETRRGQISNNTLGLRELDFACLENEHLIARIVIPSGVLHNLIVRRTGVELLSQDVYPYGWVWYSRRQAVWKMMELGEGRVTLSSDTSYGREIVMTAILKPGRECIDLVYDAVETMPVKNDCFYLMSPLAENGNFNDNVMYVPLGDQVREYKYNRRDSFNFKMDEFRKPWVAVENKNTRHVFAAFFNAPTLIKISGGTQVRVFYLNDTVSPGKMHFRLCGAQGGMEKLSEWEAMWNQDGQ